MIGQIFRRLFGRPAPPPPEDRRGWNEDWRVGDLAECIDGDWPEGTLDAPRKGEIRRVTFLREGHNTADWVLISGLGFGGSTEAFHCEQFRKLRPTIEPADAAFTADLRDCLRTPAKHTA